MKTLRWTTISSSLCGTIHRTRNNQDANQRWVTEGFACSVMSDGASSADYAVEGSRMVVKALRWLVEECGESLMDLPDADLCARIAGAVRPDIEAEAAAKGVDTGELSATMAMIMCTPERYVAVNIGDGMIARIADADGSGSVILEPQRGKYVNTCRFITDPDSEAHIKVARGEFSTQDTYVLMTDGSVFCLYNYTTGRLAPALAKFADCLRRYDRITAEKAVRQAMIAKFPQYTSDDCTLMMLRGDWIELGDAAGIAD